VRDLPGKDLPGKDLQAMVPPAVVAATQTYARLGVAFGPRFFLFLVLGVLWLILGFFDLRWVYAMLAWDAFALLVWAADLVTLPRPTEFKVRRTWNAPPSLSVTSEVELTFINESTRVVHVSALDAVPARIRKQPPELEATVRAKAEVSRKYQIRPAQRGAADLGDVYIRYQSAFRIAERWSKASLGQRIQIYPNLEEAKKHSVYLVRSRQIEMEKRHTRMRGLGREFESLREYREGDEYRDICWTAAARRGKLVTRIYQIERSQTIWIVIDAGRLMRARVRDLTKLDYAVNAALSLAQVALYSGDRVGLVAYGRKLQQRLPAARGSTHLRQMMEQLATIHEETSEADHLRTASLLLTDQKRRSLIVWMTDLAETAMTPEVIDAASQMMPRHLVLFVVIGQPDLSQLAARDPQSPEEMFRIAAAQEMLHRRELLLARLRERGALALEVSSAALAPTLVNSYLEVKARNQL
jgi:uncharacterized protein (DUF58 family)